MGGGNGILGGCRELGGVLEIKEEGCEEKWGKKWDFRGLGGSIKMGKKCGKKQDFREGCNKKWGNKQDFRGLQIKWEEKWDFRGLGGHENWIFPILGDRGGTKMGF